MQILEIQGLISILQTHDYNACDESERESDFSTGIIQLNLLVQSKQ